MNQNNKIRTYIREDLKDSSGNWIEYWREAGNQYKTRAGALWSDMKARTTTGSKLQQDHPNYQGTYNKFSDFQSFAEWCNSEFGYMNTEPSGKFWALDKDIISGSKIYSPETCLFVPSFINCFFARKSSKKFDTPLGVHKLKEGDKFQSYYRVGGKKIHLGNYNDPMDAHMAWQKEKLKALRNLIGDDRIIGHTKLIKALDAKYNQLIEDINNRRETLF